MQRAPRLRRGQDRQTFRLDVPPPRPRRHPLRGPPRPLRPHADRRSPVPQLLRPRREGAPRVRHHRDGRGETEDSRHDQSRAPDRRDRNRGERARDGVGLAGDATLHPRRKGRRERGCPTPVPLPRPSPREAPQEHHPPFGSHPLPPRADVGEGIPRVPDADPDRLLARGRARLPRAEPHPPRHVLRPSAGAADVQAAPHGLGPTRPRAPTAAPASSTRWTSRCPMRRRTRSSPSSRMS